MTTITMEKHILKRLDALEDFAKEIRAALAAPATTPAQPAWHDAPTCEGMWMCNYGDLSVATVNQPDIDTFDPAYNTGGRWYGPIPPDGDKP